MGLRTASVRRPHVAVMAPALTETSQTHDIPSKAHLEPASLINSYEKNSKYQATTKETYYKSDDHFNVESDELSNAIGNLNTLVLASEKFILGKCLTELSGASDNASTQNSNIMNPSPSPMGDQENKMGLQKTGLDVSSIHKSKSSSEVDQLLNNFGAVLPESETTSDIGQNVDDIMQVIKSIEGSEQLNNTTNDLNSESEEVFPITGTDLTNNLSSFEKELLEDVDMMNITIEDQQDELDSVDRQKESQAKEVLADLQKKHAKIERRLDFLRRRVYKLQSRFMGQHISGEIVGVFETVHRSLKRGPKDSYEITKPESLGGPISSTESTPAERLKPMSYGSAKTLVRKLEMSAVLQANTASRQRHSSKYFGSGSVELPTFRSNVSGMLTLPSWPVDAKHELQKVVGQLQTQLGLVQEEVDSEATESSSGGESCDEMQSYNNPHQQYLSIQKRALWKYSTDRAAIAARWTWLQAQIADLEYRIRQHTDLHNQVRSNKGAVHLGGTNPPPPATVLFSPTTVNGYRGQLPGSSPLVAKAAEGSGTACPTPEFQYQCSRTRPLVNFKKRKLLQISGLHVVSKKAARPSTIRCGCVPPSAPCALCTGRTDPTHPRDPPETLSKAERIALLDPCFHPVFSLPEDVSQTIHLEAIMKTTEWQQRSSRMKTMRVLSKPERLEPKLLEHRAKKLDHRKKYTRLLKPSTMSALSAKIKNKIRGRKPGRHPLNRLHRRKYSTKDGMGQLNPMGGDGVDEEIESIGNNSNAGTRSLDSPSSSPLLQMQSISGYNRTRNRVQSYDIDNIVIPYSVAASTRVEKLQYKEILTPKWRIAEMEINNKTNISKNNVTGKDTSQDSDVEDLSEEAMIARHERCEYEEKKKFLSYLKLPIGYGRSRAHKRTDSRAESSGANTPDPMSPHAVDPQENTNSPMTSPPATPLSTHMDDSGPLPSIAVMRKRTISQSRFTKEKESKEEPAYNTLEDVEVAPYERRIFPITDELYEKMLKNMPEDHQFKTNIRAQDSSDNEGGGVVTASYLDKKVDSPDSESTESAIGDGDEDPNDPEWIDMERANRDRYKR